MKKIIKYWIFIVFCIGICFFKVSAITFKESYYLGGEYISKEKNGKKYYLNLQYIEDENGNIVYCLEPFVSFDSSGVYEEYIGDRIGFNDLTKEQIRKIELLAYYGYGYGNRKSTYWYAATQFLIWQIVDPDADTYFTDKLNGERVERHELYIKMLLRNIEEHDTKPLFIKEYDVNYNDNLVIDYFNNDYEVVFSDFDYDRSNGFVLKNVLSSGVIKARRISDNYSNKVMIFDSNNSQDLIKPGNVENEIYTIDINVKKGNIILDIDKDDSVYTVESDFRNTCYEILKNSEVVDKICTGEDELYYKSVDLPYGDYEIKQISNGIGYKKDSNVYNVNINSNNELVVVSLFNNLIKNKKEIEKKACKDNICVNEEGALFSIYDRNNNLVDTIITDNKGLANIIIGYGTYNIEQVKGMENYTLAESFSERIVDEVSIHNKIIYNMYENLEIDDVIKDKIDSNFDNCDNLESEDNEGEILPPKTSVDSTFFDFIYKVLAVILEINLIFIKILV